MRIFLLSIDNMRALFILAWCAVEIVTSTFVLPNNHVKVDSIRSSHKFVPFFVRLCMLRLFTYLSVSWKNVIPPSLYNFFQFFKCIGPSSPYVYKSTHEIVYTKVGTNLWDDLIFMKQSFYHVTSWIPGNPCDAKYMEYFKAASRIYSLVIIFYKRDNFCIE